MLGLTEVLEQLFGVTVLVFKMVIGSFITVSLVRCPRCTRVEIPDHHPLRKRLFAGDLVGVTISAMMCEMGYPWGS